MKAAFFCLHLALAALLAWQCYTLFYLPLTGPAPLPITGSNDPNTPAQMAPDTAPHGVSTPKPGNPDPKRPTAVIQRNLFKVDIDKRTSTPPPLPPEPSADKPLPEKTKLKLVLWGTVTGDAQSANWTVIENKKTRSQELYRAGDTIVGAQIKSITRNQVILVMDGKEQLLEAQTPSSSSTGKGSKSGRVTDKLPKGIDLSALENAKPAENIFSRFRSRPYMKDGRPAGVLIYGLRPGSQALSVGLRNGDIIKTINDTEINNSKDLKGVAKDLAQGLELRIVLSRRGQEKEIVFKGADE